MLAHGLLSLSKIIGGGGGGTPHRRILLFCKMVYYVHVRIMVSYNNIKGFMKYVIAI